MKLKEMFEEAYERCRTTPLEGVSFTIDDFHAAIEKYDFNSEIGTKVTGTVFSTDAKGALVDITAKSSAYLPVKEASIYSIKTVEEAGIYLACIDHRGTPELPARTCTLEEDEGSICWGTAYCVRGGPEKERSAMEYLRRRECEYDRETLVDFYTDVDSEQPFITGMIVFTSTPDKVSNKYYLGPAPLLEMATQIATALGPLQEEGITTDLYLFF